MLRAMEEDLVSILQNIDPTGVGAASYRTARLSKLLESVRTSIRGSFADVSAFNAKQIAEIASTEAVFGLSVLNEYLVAVPVNAVGISPDLAASLANGALIDGAPSAEWWERQGANLQRKFSDQMRMGVSAGESVGDLVRRVRGKHTGKYITTKLASGATRRYGVFEGGLMDATTRDAESLVRTSVQAASAEARRATYRRNPDLVKGVVQVSTLDDRVTMVCMAYHNKAFDMEGEPIGHDLPYDGGTPRHWKCRSVEAPWLASASELGLPVKDLPRGVVATMNGARPGPVSMSKFLRGLPASTLRGMVGARRAEMLATGQIETSELVSAATGRVLTTAQLRELVLQRAQSIAAAIESGPIGSGVEALKDVSNAQLALWMGREGMTVDEMERAFQAMGRKPPTKNSLRWYKSKGSTGTGVNIVTLDAEQTSYLKGVARGKSAPPPDLPEWRSPSTLSDDELVSAYREWVKMAAKYPDDELVGSRLEELAEAVRTRMNKQFAELRGASTAVLGRTLGAEGYSLEQAESLLSKMGRKYNRRSLQSAMSNGRSGRGGAVIKLTPTQKDVISNALGGDASSLKALGADVTGGGGAVARKVSVDSIVPLSEREALWERARVLMDEADPKGPARAALEKEKARLGEEYRKIQAAMEARAREIAPGTAKYGNIFSDDQLLALATTDKRMSELQAALRAITKARAELNRSGFISSSKFKTRLHEILVTKKELLPRSLMNAPNEVSDSVKDAAKWLRSVWRGGTPEWEVKFNLSESGGRAFCLTRGAISRQGGGWSHSYTTSTVQLYSWSSTLGRTTVHELGHWLEHSVERVSSSVRTWFANRVKGYETKHLGASYEWHEVYKKDKFYHNYMGKIYKDTYGRSTTEVLSMGLELMYDDPWSLYSNDRDMFEFILKLMLGL